MRRVFADAVYWVALAHSKDQWHARAVAVSQSLSGVGIVTTEEVLSEFLVHFSAHGRILHEAAVRYVEGILANPDVVVRPQSHQSFLDGQALDRARPDKEYSLTDCVSMEAMRQEGITEALTHDTHFKQEGFVILL